MNIRLFFLFILFFTSLDAQEVLKENLSKKVTIYWDYNRTQPQATGSYFVDQTGESTLKHGKWMYFDRLGEVEEERNYYKDLLHGKVASFFPAGNPKQLGYFILNRQDSIFREWNENAKLTTEGNYKLGNPTGIWRYFYPDGREKSSEETKAGINYIHAFWLPDEKHTQTIIDGEGEMSTYFSTGRVKEWYNFKDGLKNGPFEEFSIYGYQLLTGSFKNGEKDSTWTYHYYTGDIEKISTYAAGKLNGPYKYFYDTGVLNVEGSYKDGKKEGEWTWYTNQGQRDQQGGFKDDLQHGLWTYWFPNGQVSYTAHYTDGKKSGEWSYFYQNGAKFKVGSFDNDEKNGNWKTWYENGNLLMNGDYLNGKEQGKWDNYWENGTLKNTTTFKNGNMSGDWLSYYPSGKLKLTGVYKDNFKTGKWINYFENGNVKDEVTYKIFSEKSKVDYGFMKKRVRKESKEHGLAVYYSDKDYRKTEEGKFVNGSKDGLWTAYYPGGKYAAVTSTYANGELNGTMKNYDRRGKLLQEIEYKDGLKHGKFIIYDKKGKASITKQFEYGMEIIKGNEMRGGGFSPN
ncbi:MAG: hypothetical protein V4638_00065 [Bacteroidota bacterium]